MKSIYLYLLLVLLAANLSSCKSYEQEYEAETQKQALLKENLKDLEEEAKFIRGEYDDALVTLNAIEDSLRAMADRDRKVQRLLANYEAGKDISQKEAIMQKVKALRDANEQTKSEAKRLQSKAKNLNIENKKIKKMIADADVRLAEIEESIAKANSVIDDMKGALGQLQGELATTNSELGNAYIEIKERNDRLQEINSKLEQKLAELENKNEFISQDAKAYVVCGSRQSLRKNNILSTFSVKKLHKDYLENVQEKGTPVSFFENDEIACSGEGEIINVLPERERTSYRIENDVVVVTNANKFWATDKVVVIIKK